jgi:ferric-dicitrate binding protein FerR (iron transport regulator)
MALSKEMQHSAMAWIDGEMSEKEKLGFEEMLAGNPQALAEVQAMKRVHDMTSTVGVPEPPEEFWNELPRTVFQRGSRRVGWFLSITGVSLLTMLGIYLFATTPELPLLCKISGASLLFGLLLLFLSIARQRMQEWPSDKYKDIMK